MITKWRDARRRTSNNCSQEPERLSLTVNANVAEQRVGLHYKDKWFFHMRRIAVLLTCSRLFVLWFCLASVGPGPMPAVHHQCRPTAEGARYSSCHAGQHRATTLLLSRSSRARHERKRGATFRGFICWFVINATGNRQPVYTLAVCFQSRLLQTSI